MKPLTVRELPLTERPDAKALAYGVSALSEAELLSIVIEPHVRKHSSIVAGEHLLAKIGNLRQLSQATTKELVAVGITQKAALRVQAALEVGRRMQQVTLRPGTVLNNAQQAFAHYHERLRDQKKEYFYTVTLDTKRCVIREEVVSIGNLNTAIVHPREVFALAITDRAESIIFAHNHPSGDPTPSPEDIDVTRRLAKVGEVVGIEVLDHIIIGNGCYCSFKEQRLL